MVRTVHVLTPPRGSCPGILTASPEGLLGYEDRAACNCEMAWLDCKTCPPAVLPAVRIGGYHVTHTAICCESDDVIVATRWDFRNTAAFYSFNTRTCAEPWTVYWFMGDSRTGLEKDDEIEDPQGLTVDRRGHAFVCKKSGVHVYSTKDGRDLGLVVKQGKAGIGKPFRIDWCNVASSLIVAHKTKDDVIMLSALRMQYN